MALVIGRIYKLKTGRCIRIFKSGGAGFFSGRGSNKSTAVPMNHIKEEDVVVPFIEEINAFLEEEMASGMAQTTNKKK